MEIKNARISSTMLGYEDHGILSCMLYLDYEGSSQGFGGYCLDTPLKTKNGKFIKRIGCSFGMEFIARILQVVGVEKWENLVGKHIRVEASWTEIKRIGNILKDEWLDPKELAKEFKIK